MSQSERCDCGNPAVCQAQNGQVFCEKGIQCPSFRRSTYSDPRILTLDVESRYLADEVGGWSKFLAGAGGISALVIHSTETGRYHCFNDTNLEKAAVLIDRMPSYLITYNGKGFDLPLIQAILGRPIWPAPARHIDLYQLIKSALREGDPKNANSLDAVCRRTLGYGKDAEGLHAPVLAAEGRWLELFRYCKKDVELTRRLFQFAREHGGVISHSGDLLPLALPEWFRLGATEATK